MRIGLVGFFGWGNFGDELFFETWQEALSGHELIRMNDLITKPYFESSAIQKARSVDAILIGGGDLIRTESISQLYWNGAWTQKPIIISGIGVAKESATQRDDVIPRLAKFFNSVNIMSICTRDDESSRWIRENLDPLVKVRVAPDLVFSNLKFENFRSEISAGEVTRISFVFNKTDITDSDMYYWNAISAAHLNEKIEIRLLVLATGDQKAQELRVLEESGLLEYAETFESTDEMLEALHSSDLVISAKFHALIVAAKFGIPYISLRETSKSSSLSSYLPSVPIPESLSSILKAAAGKSDEREASINQEIENISRLARAEVDRVSEIMDIISKIRRD